MLVPLMSPEWFYNTDTRRLEMVFRVAPPEGTEDPASFVADKEYRVEVPLPQRPVVTDLDVPTPPTPPQSAEEES